MSCGNTLMITIEVNGGLTSRLDVVSTIINSGYYPEHIQMTWPKVPGMMANFNELYDDDFIKFEYKDQDNSLPKHEYGTELNPLLGDRKICADWPIRFIGKKTEFNFKDEQFLTEYRKFYNSLKPVQEIQDVINQYSPKFGDKTFGINMRRGVGINYHSESCIYSPTRLFIGVINQIKEANKDNQCFITTDSFYDLETICFFNSNIFCIDDYIRYPLDGGYTLSGMKRTLIDWLLLTRTQHLYVSKNAGFGIRAAIIGDKSYTEVIDNSPDVVDYHAKKQQRLREGKF